MEIRKSVQQDVKPLVNEQNAENIITNSAVADFLSAEQAYKIYRH